MTEAGKGVGAMMLACIIWGLSPLYYKLIDHIPPIEILAHRTIWSCVFFTVVLLVQGRLSLLFAQFRGLRPCLVLAFSSLMISLNWFVFITAIQIGKTVEASLGYFIFPLVSVMLGRIFFAEVLGRAQTIAVGLAALAVLILTLGLGVPPWISLLLGTSFGMYGAVKKWISTGPVVSVTGEVLLLLPIAAILLGQIHGHDNGHFLGSGFDTLMLGFAGIMTGTPLILFSYATKRVALATVGVLQYINPSLHFIVATMIFREVFSVWHAIAFALIWTALVVYTMAAWRQESAARRRTERVSTSSTS